MAYYKLIIAYDGFDYHGWQVQPGKRTICGDLERAFKKVFKQLPTWFVGASRTDTGVHAWGQVAIVQLAFDIEPDTLKKAWQGYLPGAIMLRDVQYADDQFHPQHNVLEKVYEYNISTERVSPFQARYCLVYTQPFDVQLLNEYLQVFVGTHDFRSFCTGSEIENTVRSVESITIMHDNHDNLYTITVRGPGFLRYMIRRMVGASLHVMTQKLKGEIADGATYLRDILEQRDPAQQLKTAPGHGLMLRSIQYDE